MSWSRAAFPSRRSSVRNTWSLPNPFQRRRRCYWRCTRRRAQFLWLYSRCGQSTNRRHLHWCFWVRSPAPCNCWMPESGCLSMILGNALGRSLSLSSNFSWCICFTDPCGSRRKPSADKRNLVVVRPPPAGLVLRSRLVGSDSACSRLAEHSEVMQPLLPHAVFESCWRSTGHAEGLAPRFTPAVCESRDCTLGLRPFQGTLCRKGDAKWKENGKSDTAGNSVAERRSG